MKFAAIFVHDDFVVITSRYFYHENLTNLKIYAIIYLQGEERKKNLHHLYYA